MERLISILKNILSETDSERIKELISEFQNIVWNDDNVDNNDHRFDVFIDLADSFEYLLEETWYTGFDKIEKEVQETLKKIDRIKHRTEN